MKNIKIVHKLLSDTKERLILYDHEELAIHVAWGISSPCAYHNNCIKEVSTDFEICRNYHYTSKEFEDISDRLGIFNTKTFCFRNLTDIEYALINIDIVSIRLKQKAFEKSCEGIRQRAKEARENILLLAKLNALNIK